MCEASQDEPPSTAISLLPRGSVFIFTFIRLCLNDLFPEMVCFPIFRHVLFSDFDRFWAFCHRFPDNSAVCVYFKFVKFRTMELKKSSKIV